MRNLFDLGVSIEKMAAYLDENLPSEEMEKMSHIINSNDSLQHFIHQSDAIDDTLSSYSPSDVELPMEFEMQDFMIPPIDNVYAPNLVTLTPESIHDDLMVAACAMEESADDIKSIIDESHDGRFNPFDHASDLDNHNSLLNHSDNGNAVEDDGFSHIGEDI